MVKDLEKTIEECEILIANPKLIAENRRIHHLWNILILNHKTELCDDLLKKYRDKDEEMKCEYIRYLTLRMEYRKAFDYRDKLFLEDPEYPNEEWKKDIRKLLYPVKYALDTLQSDAEEPIVLDDILASPTLTVNTLIRYIKEYRSSDDLVDIHIMRNIFMYYLINDEKSFAYEMLNMGFSEGLIESSMIDDFLGFHNEKGEDVEAASLAKWGIDNSFKSEYIYETLAQTLWNKNDMDGVIDVVTAAIDSNMESYAMVQKITSIFDLRRQFEDVIDILEDRILEIDDITVINYLIRAYNGLDRDDLSISLLESKKEKGIEHPVIFGSLFIKYMNDNQTNKAISIAEEAIAKDLDDEVLLSVLAMHFRALGERSYYHKVIDRAIDKKRIIPTTAHMMWSDGLIDSDDYAHMLNECKESFYSRRYHEHLFYAFYLADLVEKEGPVFGKTRDDYLMEYIQILKQERILYMFGDYLENRTDIKFITQGERNMQRFLIKRRPLKDKSIFAKELANRERLDKIMDDQIKLPDITGILEDDNDAFIVIRHELGLTLTEAIKNRQLDDDDYYTILNNLCKIWNEMPIDGRYDFKVRFPQYAKIAGLWRERELFLPVLNGLEGSGFWVYNNDSHSDNFLLGDENELMFLDTAIKDPVPMSVELAHFLNFIPYKSFEERLGLVEEVHKAFGMKVGVNNFIEEFCLGTIFRSVEKQGYYFVQEREDDYISAIEAGQDAASYLVGRMQNASEISDIFKWRLSTLGVEK